MAKRIVIGKNGEVIESILPDPDFEEMDRVLGVIKALSPKPCGGCPACVAKAEAERPAPVPVEPEPALHTGVYL